VAAAWAEEVVGLGRPAHRLGASLEPAPEDRRQRGVDGHPPLAFPGSVRELENAIEHAFVMCPGEQIEVEHLPHHIVDAAEAGTLDPQSEKQLIAELLARHHGNRSRVASEQGMHRTTLWRKLKQYQLDS
jgi:DNA-binding NtrC family response regulator